MSSEEGFWAKVGDTLTRIRDKALEGVIENAVDIQHVDLLLARLTRVRTCPTRMTSLSTYWTDIFAQFLTVGLSGGQGFNFHWSLRHLGQHYPS